MDDIIFQHRDARNFLPNLKGDSANLVLTDPPYLVSRKTGFNSVGSRGVERFRVSMDFGEWDNVPNGEHIELLTAVFKECYRILKSSGVIIVFYDLWKIETLATILKASGFTMFRFIEWIKTNPVPLNSRQLYLSNARETAIVAVKKNKPTFNAHYHNGIFTMPIHRDGGKRLHPTQKPLKLMKELIAIHTKERDVVLDPFAGSATTIVASTQMNRIAWGCEKDKLYYDRATKRIQKESP